MRRRRGRAQLGLLLTLLPGTLAFERTEARESCASHEVLRQPFFGDTHVHTALSFDAWGQGTRNTPVDAYRFARGEAVGVQPYDAGGEPLRSVRLRRPLDFAIVTDHAELLGETRICVTPDAPGHDSLVCRVARRWPLLGYMIVNSQIFDERDPRRYGFCGEEGGICREAAAAPWREIQEAAEGAYDRSRACRFTTFVGYEWSGNPDSRMIHRNVVFRNEIVPRLPASYLDTGTGEALWRRLRRECLEGLPGCDVLAIPHNPNLSGGLLFRTRTEDGAPLDRAGAALRASLEVLVEITQHKGDSECRSGGATADELCGFETLSFGRMAEVATPWAESPPAPGVYVREVLASGLREQARLGVNPFKLGIIGSTDTHLGTPGLVDEDRFVGHAAGRVTSRLRPAMPPDDLRFNPGGLAVVWAEENSRDALFEAMRRRETYGTSGPRMLVRFFGGWSYPPDLCASKGFVASGYAGGVPMGADLPARPQGAGAPVFAAWALADPGTPDRPGTPLQRIQIVKAFLDPAGTARERVFEVAGDPRNGADVDPASCGSRGTGFDSLCTVWSDPSFDPERPALYYARVVENPSCRWNAFLCAERRVDCSGRVPQQLSFCCDGSAPATIQERAWTSPIWYTPQALGEPVLTRSRSGP